jgi:ABC-type nitrate/sulfonate/bicarbonate transport system permease component
MISQLPAKLDRRHGHRRRILMGLIRAIPPLFLLGAGIGIWQIVTVARQVPDYILPPPSEIWQTAIDERQLLWDNALPTLRLAMGGFLLALVLGLLVAVLIRYSRALEATLYPIVIVSQTVPVLVLAPILVAVLGFTVLPKLIVVCLICFFPITVNTVDGLRSVDPDLANLMRTLGAGRWQRFRQVEWPTALPFLFSGAKVAITYSIVGAIFGEWVGSSEGLGWYMIQAKSQLDISGLFAAGIILTILGVALFGAVSVAERLLLPWYHSPRRNGARVVERRHSRRPLP